MPIIVRMERLQRGCWLRVAILCMLFGLWGFIPLAGAAMTTASKAADKVVMGMPADALLAMSVTPDAWGVMVLPEGAMNTVAPLPGILVAGQPPDRPPCSPPGNPRPGLPPCPPPEPPGRPSPSR